MTKIEWTHRPGTKGCTLNPIRARNTKTGKRGWYCEKVCEACRHCYAEDRNLKAGASGGTGLPYKPSMREFADIYLDDKTLLRPLHWRTPRTIFWCSMTDPFGPWVSEEWVLRMFAVCALTPEHTHIFLTKRAQAMWEHIGIRPAREMLSLLAGPVHEIAISLEGNAEGRNWAREALERWPLPNVWLGVTAGDQATADQRIPLLLGTPAAVRFVSIEPMLGPVDLYNGDPDPRLGGHKATHTFIGDWWEPGNNPRHGLDWVICGGETGKEARPMHPDWARSLRDQCRAADVPLFFKQWGEWKPCTGVDVYCHGPKKNRREFPNAEGIAWLNDGRICLRDFSVAEHKRRMAEHIAYSVRAIEVDEAALTDFHASLKDQHRAVDNPLGLEWMYRAGKARAGRLLDGREHTEWPEARP